VELAYYAAGCARSCPSPTRVSRDAPAAAAHFAARREPNDVGRCLPTTRSDYWPRPGRCVKGCTTTAAARRSGAAAALPCSNRPPPRRGRPRRASTYDWARAETHLYLHHDAEAKALLEASERALPDDYNPGRAASRSSICRLGELTEALARGGSRVTESLRPAQRLRAVDQSDTSWTSEAQRDAARAGCRGATGALSGAS